MNQSAIWKEEKKNRLKASFHFVQYELSQESNLAHTVKQRKNYPTLDVKCDLRSACDFEILKRIPKDLWSWGHDVLMISFLCTYPQAARWGPEKLKLTSDIMNTLNDEAAGQGQAAFLKHSGCVSALRVSRRRQGKEMAYWAIKHLHLLLFCHFALRLFPVPSATFHVHSQILLLANWNKGLTAMIKSPPATSI